MTITISGQQDLVLKIIQDYLDNNRILNLDKVVPYIRNVIAKKNLNINNNGIKQILKELIEKRHIIQGSKLIREDVLKNENRKKTYETIKANPGCYFNTLKKHLDLTNHIITWHLNVLIKFGFLKKVKIEKHDVYFSSEVKSKNYYKLYLMSKSKSKKIISYMRNFDDGITKTMIATNLGIHYSIVTKYFNKFIEAGILKKKKFSNKTTYFLKQQFFSTD
ncbi:MAG: hypothetical protein ACFFAS_19125 [Promethearchaeota archaeon]